LWGIAGTSSCNVFFTSRVSVKTTNCKLNTVPSGSIRKSNTPGSCSKTVTGYMRVISLNNEFPFSSKTGSVVFLFPCHNKSTTITTKITGRNFFIDCVFFIVIKTLP